MKTISINNKKVSPSVAALGLTEETGAACRHTTSSKTNDTTNPAQRQTREISQSLLCVPARQKLKQQRQLSKRRYYRNDR